MTKTTKRYFLTLGISIAVLAASGLILAMVIGPPDSSEQETNKTIPAIAAIFYLAVWGSVAGFVAHEKGRGLFWIILSFIAPLQVVLLLLPHTKERRQKLESPSYDSEIKQDNISFTEKDNLGTRHDSKSISLAYWMGERMNLTRKDPFVMFTFKNEEFAQAALLELPCIHIAKDSQKLICTERLIFGYYAIDDVYEAILCGDALTVELWEQARESFSRYGGEKKNELAPQKHLSQETSPKTARPELVTYIREDRKSDMGHNLIYRIYKGPDELSATAFLQQNPVTQDLLYLVVETPEGNFCRDKLGIYKED